MFLPTLDIWRPGPKPSRVPPYTSLIISKLARNVFVLYSGYPEVKSNISKQLDARINDALVIDVLV